MNYVLRLQEYGLYLILPKLAKIQYLQWLLDIHARDYQKIQMVKKKKNSLTITAVNNEKPSK